MLEASIEPRSAAASDCAAAAAAEAPASRTARPATRTHPGLGTQHVEPTRREARAHQRLHDARSPKADSPAGQTIAHAPTISRYACRRRGLSRRLSASLQPKPKLVCAPPPTSAALARPLFPIKDAHVQHHVPACCTARAANAQEHLATVDPPPTGIRPAAPPLPRVARSARTCFALPRVRHDAPLQQDAPRALRSSPHAAAALRSRPMGRDTDHVASVLEALGLAQEVGGAARSDGMWSSSSSDSRHAGTPHSHADAAELPLVQRQQPSVSFA